MGANVCGGEGLLHEVKASSIRLGVVVVGRRRREGSRKGGEAERMNGGESRE